MRRWQSKEESSFLKKKAEPALREAKDFYFLRQRNDTGHGLDRGSGGEVKVFWFFFSKKNCFLAFVT